MAKHNNYFKRFRLFGKRSESTEPQLVKQEKPVESKQQTPVHNTINERSSVSILRVRCYAPGAKVVER